MLPKASREKGAANIYFVSIFVLRVYIALLQYT